jgi:hypothetical protein
MRPIIIAGFLPNGGIECAFIGEDGVKAEQAYESAISSGKFSVVEFYNKPDPEKRRKIKPFNAGANDGPVIRSGNQSEKKVTKK